MCSGQKPRHSHTAPSDRIWAKLVDSVTPGPEIERTRITSRQHHFIYWFQGTYRISAYAFHTRWESKNNKKKKKNTDKWAGDKCTEIMRVGSDRLGKKCAGRGTTMQSSCIWFKRTCPVYRRNR